MINETYTVYVAKNAGICENGSAGNVYKNASKQQKLASSTLHVFYFDRRLPSALKSLPKTYHEKMYFDNIVM